MIAGRKFGGRPVCYGAPLFDVCPGSRLSLGNRVLLISAPHYTALGVPHPVLLRTMTPTASLTIGDDTGISGSSIVAAKSISIGSRVLIGSGGRIFDTDFHPVAADGRRFAGDWNNIACSAVTIEDDAFIGTGAIICKGLTIGRGSIVAAGSVVVKDVPPMTIVGGNPSKHIGDVPA